MAKVVHSGFNRVLALLRQHTDVDFTHYKQATLRRRMERRMSARKIRSTEEYSRYLRSHPDEIRELFEDVLIHVTSFFRDPAVFKALKANYLCEMARAKASEAPIRIWVPACSTGEEVYSLAILLTELKDDKNSAREIQIFGTDVNNTVLEKARAGIYPETIRTQVSPERLRRFFEPIKGGFRVGKRVRDLCIFARHNLAVDPPFGNLDLISCRNALIYMGPSLQEKIFPVFHFALKPNGLLLLGQSETVGKSSDLFVSRDKDANLFLRKARSLTAISKTITPASHYDTRSISSRPRHRAAVMPPKLGRAELRATIEKIVGLHQEEARVVPVAIPNTDDNVYLVLVDSRKTPSPNDTADGPSPLTQTREAEIGRLRRELLSTRKSLEAVIEQQEAINEELRAANEEVVSSNEELHSTNEELETAREELQASNEELATLNGELENRNAELERASVISEHFKALVDSSDDAIISKDLNGIIHTWNNAARKIFGYTAEEVIGKPVTVLFPPELVHEEPVILAKLRSGQHIDHYETLRRRKDGKIIDVSLTVSPIKDSAGRIIGASKIARDITEKKQAEQEIRRARDEAEQASRAKDDFLAVLSHELRTPLNPVLLVASDAAADHNLSPGIRANFDLIRRNVELEARLIDDLLDLARVRAGKLKVEKRQVNVHAVLSATISMVQSEIEQKNISLIQKLGESGGQILGDTVRLQQIFWNVLKNAIKFTPPNGEITIEAGVEHGEYWVKISDNGVGMSEKELAHAFDAFQQGDHSEDARRFGGLGLGLTISKNLVQLHSGKIEAWSKGRGHGAVFTMRFPMIEPGPYSANGHLESPAPIKPSKLPSSLNILLVEDHEPTRTALARLLINRRHRVTMAGTAAEALALNKKTPFDLVISDIGLPDGNGYDLFKAVREHSPRAKGIALTGYGMDRDLEHSKNSGFLAHLTKPVRIQALEAALADIDKG